MFTLVMRPLPAILGMLCLFCALAAATQHPLSPTVTVASSIAATVLAYRWPAAGLTATLAAVPILGLAPWSGWITFEELDLLVLSVAAGGYGRLTTSTAPAGGASPHPPPLVWLLLMLFSASLGVSAWRGMSDAGGFGFAWFEGYQEPMNSVRLAKSFFLALLLFPLWGAAHRESPVLTCKRVSLGMLLGLAGASLAVLWERFAFTGLLNFSTDYRTTALFWEMHVGGAALDGFLALTTPFAVLELSRPRPPWRTALTAAVLLAGAYACVTSFSRGVYAAVPLGVVLTMWLASREQQNRRDPTQPSQQSGWLAAGVLVLVFAASAAWMFPSSGYRGMLALFGAYAVLLRLKPITQPIGTRHVLGGTALAAGLVSAALLATWWLPKGAYVAYAVACTGALALSMRQRNRQPLLFACYLCVIACIGLVAWHWGGATALGRAYPVMTLLAVAGAARVALRQGPWPTGLHRQAGTAASLAVAGALVAVMSGGAYMSGRFSTSADDFSGRLAHWREGLELLDTTGDHAFGKGLGRYPANHLLAHSSTDAPGDYRLSGIPGDQHLLLTGGKLALGWGELLRVSQRVSAPEPPLTIRFKVRSGQMQGLHFEVCEKHLLYNGNCLIKAVKIEPTGNEWHIMQAQLQGDRPSRGAWYAPRLISFSVANATSGALVEVDDLALQGADGRNMLANGDFSLGMSHWFFSSDRNHMPWHLKNIAVHTMFDQGLVGLALLAALVVGAMWRTGLGSARSHPLAPAIAGALLGFLVVGMFDSLLDVPRVAFVFYLLLLLGLTLQWPRNRPVTSAAGPVSAP